MEKIKVIDLYNKIAKGEEVPKQLRYEYKDYIYKDNYEDYYCEEESRYLFETIVHDENWKLSYAMNIRVEIIEDTPKVQVEMTQEEYNEYLDRKLNTPKEDNKIEKLDIYFNGYENKISIEDATDTDTQIEFVAYRLNDMIDEFYKLKEKVDRVNGE